MVILFSARSWGLSVNVNQEEHVDLTPYLNSGSDPAVRVEIVLNGLDPSKVFVGIADPNITIISRHYPNGYAQGLIRWAPSGMVGNYVISTNQGMVEYNVHYQPAPRLKINETTHSLIVGENGIFQVNDGDIITIEDIDSRLATSWLEVNQVEIAADLTIYNVSSYQGNISLFTRDAYHSNPTDEVRFRLEKSTPPPTKYSLTVVNGTGSGSYEAGAAINISANTAPAGKQFKNWTTSNGGTFGNANSANTTFTMPSNATTVTANYEDIPVTKYQLTVVSGTGGGSYEAGASVGISAGTPPSGKQFKNWTTSNGGTFGNANSANTTFTMPPNATTVTANYEDIPVTKYQLTVVSGTGSGSYEAGASVGISAGTPPSGKQFKNWTTSNGGTFGNAGSANTTFTMPSNATTVTANYEDIPVTKYQLTVVSGTGSGSYEAGASVGISAGTPPSGKQFKNWTTSNGGTFGNAGSANTTFTMPPNATTVTANYEDIPVTTYSIVSSAGSGGSISPSGTITVTQGESETFTWTPEEGYEVEEVKVNGNIISTTENSYTFSNVQANGTISVSFRSVTAIEDINPSSLKIWSPSSGTIRISSEELLLEVRVYTLTGSLLRIISPNSGEVTISNLPQGVVIVRVQTQSGTNSVKLRIEN